MGTKAQNLNMDSGLTMMRDKVCCQLEKADALKLFASVVVSVR